MHNGYDSNKYGRHFQEWFDLKLSSIGLYVIKLAEDARFKAGDTIALAPIDDTTTKVYLIEYKAIRASKLNLNVFKSNQLQGSIKFASVSKSFTPLAVINFVQENLVLLLNTKKMLEYMQMERKQTLHMLTCKRFGRQVDMSTVKGRTEAKAMFFGDYL